MEILREKDKDFCEMAGLFGCLIAITCILQQFFFMESHWISYCIAAVYVLCLVGFFLLTRKSALAFPLLLTGAISTYILEVGINVLLTFSLVLVILLLYTTAIVSILWIDQIQNRLTAYNRQLKAEENEWEQTNPS